MEEKSAHGATGKKKYKSAQTIVLIGFEDKTMYYVGKKYSDLTNFMLTNVCTRGIMTSMTGTTQCG